jgi:hypothetical protein
LVHGGGFSDCGTLNADDMKTLCVDFAKHGFVVFNVEYRRGRVLDLVPPPPSIYTSVQQEAAAYRAIQDVRGAIRSIILRQINHSLFSQDQYQIDINNIFVGGNSAGSVTTLAAAYYPDPNMIYSVFPTVGTYTIQQILGDIDNDYYYASIVDVPNYQSHIRGVLNMWGSINLPTSYASNPTSFFSGLTNKPPVISFHGEHDPVFPPDASAIKFSPTNITGHLPYNTSTYCLINSPYQLQGLASTADLIEIGSRGFYDNILTQFNPKVPAELYIDCNMMHGLDKDCGGCPSDPTNLTIDKNCNACVFDSEFGTGLVNREQVEGYIVQRTCVFSRQSLLI